MFTLTDETIEVVIDSVAGFVIATVATETGLPLGDVALQFYSSDVYALLSDKSTGCYFDSIPEMIEDFYAEVPALAIARKDR